MKTRQMTLILDLIFPIWLSVIFIFEFENTQNSFSCGPPVDPFWSLKYLNYV